MLQLVIFVLPTPIKLSVLNDWLSDYPAAQDAKLLSDGFATGFSLQFKGPRVPRDAPCLSFASCQPRVVGEKIKREIELGRIAGPFQARPFPNLQCSPIGLVPKSQPGSFRLIHHLSYPAGASINDFIDKDLYSVHYASLDTAVQIVQWDFIYIKDGGFHYRGRPPY